MFLDDLLGDVASMEKHESGWSVSRYSFFFFLNLKMYEKKFFFFFNLVTHVRV